jgi:hypothetical protein
MTEQRTVVVQRRTLTDFSEFLWRMVHDLTHPDELRDEAHSLAFLLSEIMCYACTSGIASGPGIQRGWIIRSYSVRISKCCCATYNRVACLTTIVLSGSCWRAERPRERTTA